MKEGRSSFTFRADDAQPLDRKAILLSLVLDPLLCAPPKPSRKLFRATSTVWWAKKQSIDSSNVVAKRQLYEL